jgi:hypothetical protein
MNRVLRNFFFVLALVVSAFCTPASFAQQTQATLTGVVEDPQNATIPNAEVTVKNIDTSITRTVSSNSTGRYTITNLNPGNYSLTVKSPGFSEKVLTGIVLTVGQEAGLNVALTLGGASDVVTVNAAASVTDTESSSQGAVIDNKQVVELPLNQRTFYGLALLTPGATIPGQNSTLGFRGGFNVAGNNETANTFTINGIDDNDQNVMAPSFRPSVEGIQEFKLLTGVYSAEYGRTSGGQVVVVTKTGTNKIHGDLFEFIRNSQFDAKNYFTVPGTPTTFRRNQFGGTIGGPIIKDKAFVFLSYEGMRLAQPVVATSSVPNPAFKTGDFSTAAGTLVNPDPTSPFQFATVNGRPNQINPLAFNTKSSGYTQPGIGIQSLRLYPNPDGDPTGAATTTASPTYTLNRKRIENLDEGSARGDYKLTEKDSFLVQGNYFNDPSFEPSNTLCSSATIPLFGCYVNQISVLAGVNWTHVINERWLNEFRFGLDRLEQPRIGEDLSLTSFPKVTGAFNDVVTGNGGTPTIAVTGYPTLHPYSNLPQHRWDNHYNLVDNVSWSHGKHNVKFGVNLLQARYSIVFVNTGTGSFTFTGSKTATGGINTSGNSVSDLAFGQISTDSRVTTAPRLHYFYNAFSGYVQDDWKVTPRLTINAGIRYEYFSPTQDRANEIASWQLPTAGAPAGTLVVAGQGGYGSKIYQDDTNNYAPRLGLAYQPFGSEKTVVHAAFGIYYNAPSIGNGANLTMGIGTPFRLSQSFTSATGAQLQLDTAPFPAATPNLGTSINPYPSGTFAGIDPKFATMVVDEYGMDVQQQLTPTMAVTIAYQGNEGSRIPRQIEPNQGIVTASTATSVSARFPLGGQVLGPAGQTGGPYYTVAQSGTAMTYYISSGHGNYNALNVKLQQAYHAGFSLLLAFSWSHSIDNASGYASGSNSSNAVPQDSNNLRAERGTSDFNVPVRIVISPVYELPFGKGKPYLSSGIGRLVAGGWQLSGIYTHDTGRAFTVSMTTTNRSGSGVNADRPNVIGNVNAGPKTVTQFFNTAAFTANNFGQFGNEARNAVLGPNYDDLDVSIQRTFDISERFKTAFRFESFDLLNKANFFNPLSGSASGYNAIGAYGTAKFGQLTQANDPRSLQFSLKLLF